MSASSTRPPLVSLSARSSALRKSAGLWPSSAQTTTFGAYSSWSVSKMSFLFTTPATMRSQRLRRPSEDRCGQAVGDGSGSRDLRLRCHPSELRHARCHVDEAAAEFGLGPAERYQFVFAVNEAVTNAIRHGEPDSDGT